MLHLDEVVKAAVSASWPYFVTLLAWVMLFVGKPRMKGWSDFWRFVALAAAFLFLAFVALALYERTHVHGPAGILSSSIICPSCFPPLPQSALNLAGH